MMVGLPRSGKSTIVKALGCPIVNPDSIRLALHGQRYQAEAEPMVWAIAKYMVKSLFLAGHETVVLDATNLTQVRREEWISHSWKREFVIVDTPAEVCKERAIATGMPDLVDVIDRMAISMDTATTDELMEWERE